MWGRGRKHSNLERRWMGLHQSLPLRGQRGSSQQPGWPASRQAALLGKLGLQNAEEPREAVSLCLAVCL